jgi:hypothetical protein
MRKKLYSFFSPNIKLALLIVLIISPEADQTGAAKQNKVLTPQQTPALNKGGLIFSNGLA